MKIIVSYRRSDSSATAGRIYDHLVGQFGQRSVFMDVDAIPFGTDFRSHIKEALLGSDVLLAIIGPNWLGAQPDGTRRIDDEADPVRVEVEIALANGVTVVPVLIDGTPMPGANQLPAPLKPLAFLNAAPVDMGRDFRLHAERLSRALDTIMAAKAGPPVASSAPAARGSSGRTTSLAVLGVAILLGAGGWFALGRPAAPEASPAKPVGSEPRQPVAEVQPQVSSPGVAGTRPTAAPAPSPTSAPTPPPDVPAAPVASPVAAPPQAAPVAPVPAATAPPVSTSRRSQLHGSFAWHELWTTNAASAEAFYRAVMGWSGKTTGTGAGTYTTLSSGPTLVAGLATLPASSIAQGARPTWFGYVTVTDVDESAAQARALGGEIKYGPADFPGIGRYALIADPQGAPIVLLKPLVDYPVPAQAMGAASWRELASDRDAALGFYGPLFGWTKTSPGDATSAGSDLLLVRDTTFGALRAKPAGAPSASWTYSFQVDGLEAAMARVRTAGGTVVDQPRRMHGGFWTVSCLDPQGGAFALMSRAR